VRLEGQDLDDMKGIIYKLFAYELDCEEVQRLACEGLCLLSGLNPHEVYDEVRNKNG
jgi:hypothetical protein